jgi:hypothetical protein
VFDGVPLGREQLPGAGFDLGQQVTHFGEVGRRGDRGVAGPFQHLRKLFLERPDRPADRVAVDDLVHPAELTHAVLRPGSGAQHHRPGDLEIGVFRSVDVASVAVEAVEPQEDRFFPAGFCRHGDRDALVGMILNVAVPQFMPDDERQWCDLEPRPLRCLRHAATLLFLQC